MVVDDRLLISHGRDLTFTVALDFRKHVYRSYRDIYFEMNKACLIKHRHGYTDKTIKHDHRIAAFLVGLVGLSSVHS
jgi:hypothetical protein